MASVDPMTADDDESTEVMKATPPSSGHQIWHRDMAAPLVTCSVSGVHHAEKMDVVAGDVPRREQVLTPVFPGAAMAVAGMTRQIEADDGTCEGEAPLARGDKAPQVRDDRRIPWPSGGVAGDDGKKQRKRLAIDFIGWGTVEAVVAATMRMKGSSWEATQQVGMQEWGVSFTLVLMGQAQIAKVPLASYKHMDLTHFSMKHWFSVKETNFLSFTNQGQPDSICRDKQGYWVMANGLNFKQ